MTMKATVILSGVTETTEHEGGISHRLFHRDPVQQTLVEAVAHDWHRPDVQTLVNELKGQQVTVFRHSEGMLGGTLNAAEGRIRDHRGEVFFLPKGSRRNGYLLKPDSILDIRPGWKTQTRDITREVENAVEGLPTMTAVTQVDLEALPHPDAYDPDQPLMIGMVAFGTWPLPGGRSAGCMWLLTEYDPANDIADGYLRVADGSGGFSEHGSCYGRDLLGGTVGKVVTPARLTFADALRLGDVTDREARAIVTGASPTPAAV